MHFLRDGIPQIDIKPDIFITLFKFKRDKSSIDTYRYFIWAAVAKLAEQITNASVSFNLFNNPVIITLSVSEIAYNERQPAKYIAGKTNNKRGYAGRRIMRPN